MTPQEEQKKRLEEIQTHLGVVLDELRRKGILSNIQADVPGLGLLQMSSMPVSHALGALEVTKIQMTQGMIREAAMANMVQAVGQDSELFKRIMEAQKVQ